jgi:hypothetical protein
LPSAHRRGCFANHVLADLDAVEAARTKGLVALDSDPARTRSMTGFS